MLPTPMVVIVKCQERHSHCLAIICATCTCIASLELVGSCDPQYAKSLNANDWFRLRRALEVHHQTGRYYSSINLLEFYIQFC